MIGFVGVRYVQERLSGGEAYIFYRCCGVVGGGLQAFFFFLVSLVKSHPGFWKLIFVGGKKIILNNKPMSTDCLEKRVPLLPGGQKRKHYKTNFTSFLLFSEID